MRRLLPMLAAVPLASALLAVAPAQARPRASRPTAAQIRAAVGHAERSSKLWATINICNSKRDPGVVGIRGQMPALGFDARLRMVFSLEVWDSAKGAFKALRGPAQVADDGVQRGGTWQTGFGLHFAPHAGVVRGRITFEWRRGSRAIGRRQRVTQSGHADARYGDPSGFSASRCRLP